MPEDNIFFTDLILIPAIMLLIGKARYHMIYPTSWFNDATKSNGRFNPYYLNYEFAEKLPHVLDKIISTGTKVYPNQADRFEEFTGFFFYTYTYGNKRVIESKEDIEKQTKDIFMDIDFQDLEREYVYVDLA